jgi:hypothetical protein
MSTSILTLFSEQKIAQKASPSMLASIVAHCVTTAMLFVLVKVGVPHVVHVPPQEFSVVRVLTYNPQQDKAAAAGDHNMRLEAKNTHAMKSHAGTPRPQRRILPPNPKIKTGKQTILQAHANHVPPPTHAVIPTVLLTAAHPIITEHIFTPTPLPHPAAPTPRLLTLPNAEAQVADIMLSAAAITHPVLVLPDSTTVPYKLDNPDTEAQIVETTSPTQHPPTPTRLLAISNIQMAKGNIAIPQTEDEVQKTAAKGSLSSGQENKIPGNGSGAQNGLSILRAALSGTGASDQMYHARSAAGTSHHHQGALEIASTHSGLSQGAHGLKTADGSVRSETSADTGSGNKISFTHLTKAATGHFGAVLMGDSPEQDYPETANLWTGRSAYTVYVDVGMHTSWILQFSLPKTATPTQLQEKLSAPYPYIILRPNFAPSELNSDALLVHGFISAEGKLTSLTVEFPPGFSLAKLVLKALEQWQFRPAMLNGTPTEVEVLLIIPNRPG